MKTALINTPSGFHNLDKARQVAAELKSSDPDWRYEVVDCKNGLGRIDVYDEDGILIHKGFIT